MGKEAKWAQLGSGWVGTPPPLPSLRRGRWARILRWAGWDLRREELEELQFIVPMATVPSIGQLGILSHRRADKVPHDSIADPTILDRRAGKRVPGGLRLHDYANLYVCARNPMMTKRRSQMGELCVLRVSTDVLDLPGVVVTDGNASSDYARFKPAPEGLVIVNRELTFAEYWTDPDRIEYFRKKFAKCAEVLVPNSVPPRFIDGAWVRNEEALRRFEALGVDLEVRVNGHLFSC